MEILTLITLASVALGLSCERKTPSPQETSCSLPELRLVLTWVDPEDVVADTGPLAREIAKLFGSFGVAVEWKDYVGAREPSSREVEIHVHLRTAEPTRWKQSAGAMGVTFLQGGRARRVFVFFPSLARSIGFRPPALRALLRSKGSARFTRALTRVVAHEVFHAIAPELPHGEEGFMKAHLSRRALVTSAGELDPGAVALFKEELAKAKDELAKAASAAASRGPGGVVAEPAEGSRP